MTVSLPPTTGLPTIGVTVFDTATVFDGLTPAEVIYRYDLPGEGITGGWAGASVVEQVRTLAGEAWPDIEVTVDADDAQTDVLIRLLATKAVSARPAGAAAADEEEESDPVPAAAPGTAPAGRHRLTDGGGTLRATTVAAIVLAVVVLVGMAVLALRSSGAPGPAPDEAAGAAPAPQADISREETSGRVSPPATSTATPSSPPSSTAAEPLEFGDVRLTLPEGFSLDRDGDVVRATGPDPHLRILVAVDPLYSIGQEALFTEIARLVADDDELSAFARKADTVTYTENPGDGSQVRWTSWVDGANQISVGCHTRSEPTAGQHATCSMATDSVEIAAPGTGSG